MKEIGILFLLAILSLLNVNCGSGCGGEPYNREPTPGIEIFADKNIEYDNTVRIDLIEPKINYDRQPKVKWPLLINAKRMIFKVTKSDTIADYLFVYYKFKSVYIEEECSGEGFYPMASIDSVYSTTNYFKLSCMVLNKQ